MNIREFKIEDIEKVADLYVRVFSAPPWNDGWTTETAIKRLTQMVNCEGFYGLVCYDNDQPIGMILGNHEYFYNCVQFHIKEFCVDNDSQGKGIGREILNTFNSKLKEKGIDEAFLFTSKIQSGFYEKCGFETLDLVMMIKKVNE